MSRKAAKQRPASASSLMADLRKKLGESQTELARLLGVSPSRLSRAELDPLTRKMLCNLLSIVNQVQAWTSPEKLVVWLRTPDPDLLDLPPIDLLASDYATTLLSNTLYL